MARKQLRLTAFGSYPILANIHLSFTEFTMSVFIKSVPLFSCVNSSVTVTAQKHQVVPIQRDIRICYITGIQMHLVMHDNASIVYSFFKASFTQSPPWWYECTSATHPCRRTIESFRKLSHILAAPPQPMKSRSADTSQQSNFQILTKEGPVLHHSASLTGPCSLLVPANDIHAEKT